MIQKEELERFVKAAPKEWNAATNDADMLRFNPVNREAKDVVGGGMSFLIMPNAWAPADQQRFVGWAVEWLARKRQDTLVIWDKSEGWSVNVGLQCYGGDTLAIACFRAVLAVLEGEKS